jgi:hypothetical protein
MSNLNSNLLKRTKFLMMRLVLVLGLAAFFTACGKNRTPVYPVEGEIRYQGKAAVGAEVIFHPLNDSERQKKLRPNGRVDESGKFTLSTYQPNDGAPAGEYQVTLVWPGPLPRAVPGDSESSLGGPDRWKGRYADPEKSGLKAVVKDSNNRIPPFELK